MRKIRIPIYLEPEQNDELWLLSTKTGAPRTELIRRAIDKYLHQQIKETLNHKKKVRND